MRIHALRSAVTALLLGSANGLYAPGGEAHALYQRDFINTTGLTDRVGWDGYSFFIDGQRIFLQSGEIHPFRLPVPGLWKDVLQKMKAAGLNAVSIYTHWALHNPKAGVIDMDGVNDLDRFLTVAKEVGLFVIARPGPYINAETTGGGIPGHVLTLQNENTWFTYNGEMRSNATLFHNAWKDYVNSIGKVLVKHQISNNNGPVIMVQIENEYYNGAGIHEYIAELTQAYRSLGLTVPTMDNDPGLYQNLVTDVDIYGVDAYPASNCNFPTVWKVIASPQWRPYHEKVFPNSPFFFPEFQAGRHATWASLGSIGCYQLTEPRFQRTYGHQLWASGVTAVNYYMVYGGTNWGHLPEPNTISSYDYGASISEERTLTPKYGELKLQSLFVRSFPELRKTVSVSEDSSTHVGIITTNIQNPDTGAAWFISRHQNISDWTDMSFSLNLGPYTVPQLGGQIFLPGRDSVVTSANVTFGQKSKISYSTATLVSHLSLDGTDTLFVYGTSGLTYELAIPFGAKPNIDPHGPTNLTSSYSGADIVLNFIPAPGITVVNLSTGVDRKTVVIADYNTATRFWMPVIAAGPKGSNFWDLGGQAPLLISGPYLVRDATILGSVLALSGDLNTTTSTPITVFAPSSIKILTWNGKPILGAARAKDGTLTATLPASSPQWSLPDLHSLTWRYADSLPEISPTFNTNKAGFVKADKTTTSNPFPPYYGGPWVLYASDYGFHAGNLLWRGTFENSPGTTFPTALNLSVSGGDNFAFAAWLNDNYLGAVDNRVRTNNQSFPLAGIALRNGTNYVTVLQDHMGQPLAGSIVCCTPGGRQFDIQMPRGIQGYYLEGRSAAEQFTGWQVAGNLGGESIPDKTRKILNEGGLYGERMGWHLPGFNDQAWAKKAPWDGINQPGVGWFRTSFKLKLPDDYDIPLAIAVSATSGQYRVQIFVNGWQMGTRIANIGPQIVFPVHKGILDHSGDNTLALSLWSLGSQPQDLRIPTVELVQLAAVSGGPGRVDINNPGYDKLR